MKWLIRLLGVIVAVVLAMLIVGWMLPASHEATRAATYDEPPAAVYDAIVDVERYPAWRPGVERIEMLSAGADRLRYREHGDQGAMTFLVTEAVPPSRLVARIDDPDLPFSGSWTYELTPAEGGTTLRITERGEVSNPIVRFVQYVFFSPTETMEAYLRALGAKFGEDVEVSS